MSDNDKQDKQKKWYIVHTQTLKEDKIKLALEKELEKDAAMKEKITNIFIPTEEVVELRKNKKYVRKRKFFPGYILVQMILDDQSYWVVRNIPGVAGFLGGLKPTALPEGEAERLMETTVASIGTKPKPAVTFEKDENVRIIEGPFANFVGVVEEINEERAKLRVMVTIFGRSTPVELDFLQVEKI
jgi:transcription termination/antitermination protein NusG